jgi:hypothetical protein
LESVIIEAGLVFLTPSGAPPEVSPAIKELPENHGACPVDEWPTLNVFSPYLIDYILKYVDISANI